VRRRPSFSPWYYRSVWTWFLRVNRLNNEKWCYFIGACAAKIFIISRIDSFVYESNKFKYVIS
jgi:hypothetical protein